MWIDYELLTRVVYINLIVCTIVYSITEGHALVTRASCKNSEDGLESRDEIVAFMSDYRYLMKILVTAYGLTMCGWSYLT